MRVRALTQSVGMRLAYMTVVPEHCESVQALGVHEVRPLCAAEVFRAGNYWGALEAALGLYVTLRRAPAVRLICRAGGQQR